MRKLRSTEIEAWCDCCDQLRCRSASRRPFLSWCSRQWSYLPCSTSFRATVRPVLRVLYRNHDHDASFACIATSPVGHFGGPFHNPLLGLVAGAVLREGALRGA